MQNNIISGILEKDWNEIERKIQEVLSFSKVIHVDLIDGKFAPNVTFLNPASFSKYTKDAFFELHMMVDEPINYLKTWADAGFRRFIGHVEKMSDQIEFVEQGEIFGEVGLAVDGPTPVERVEVSLDDLDVILLMTVDAGASGQPFIMDYLEKVKQIKNKTYTPIEVDGGINDKTIIQARNSGATRFVSTSFIFQDTPFKQYKRLQKELKKTQEAQP